MITDTVRIMDKTVTRSTDVGTRKSITSRLLLALEVTEERRDTRDQWVRWDQWDLRDTKETKETWA